MVYAKTLFIMRICLVSHSFYPAMCYGGPIFSTYELCKKLAKLGFKVYVSTTNANCSKSLKVKVNKFVKLEDNFFVKYYKEQITYYLSLSLILNLWKDIKNSDVVYIQYIFHYTVPIALLFSWIFKKQTIICPRASLSPWGLKWKGFLSKSFKKLWLNFFISPFSNFVTWQGCSTIEINDILSQFSNVKYFELSDGIDTNSFKNTKKISYNNLLKKYANKNFKNISNVIFSMGRLHKIKGYDNLIKSFSFLLKQNPNCKLIIAGSGDNYKNQLINLIKNLKLENSVFLIGQLNELEKKEVLTSCSLFALCSHVESFGIVVLESLASGTPVVVSDKTIWRNIGKQKCGVFVSNEADVFGAGLLNALSKDFSPSDCIAFSKKYDINEIVNLFLKHINNERKF